MFYNNVIVLATGKCQMRIKFLIKTYGIRSYMPAIVLADDAAYWKD
jgi:hypothetical protein